jgi:hypothetical protein
MCQVRIVLLTRSPWRGGFRSASRLTSGSASTGRNPIVNGTLARACLNHRERPYYSISVAIWQPSLLGKPSWSARPRAARGARRYGLTLGVLAAPLNDKSRSPKRTGLVGGCRKPSGSSRCSYGSSGLAHGYVPVRPTSVGVAQFAHTFSPAAVVRSASRLWQR